MGELTDKESERERERYFMELTFCYFILRLAQFELAASQCDVEPTHPLHCSGKENPPASGPVLRDTARLSQRIPPYFGVSTWPSGCDTPSPFSELVHLGEHAK